jgi:hypothetical protein
LGLVVGCSAAQKEGAETNPLAALDEEKQAAAPDGAIAGPTYTVEIRREGYASKFVRLPHTGETHLQDALANSGATRMMKRMELYVLRTPPGGGPRQRMTSAYNFAERRVAWESDYAIYPGDHVVAIQDKSTEFDHMVNRFLGPLGSGK